jgi:two-component system, LytTR family, response regulator
MLHAIIIDDEENGLKSLELLILKFVPEIRIVATTTQAENSVDLINNYRPDIVFLDINMPGLNGFEVLNKVAFRKFHLIFTTAHEEYALKAIKERAIDYLLKPIGVEDLKNAVARVKNKIEEQNTLPDIRDLLSGMAGSSKTKISIPTKTGIELVMAEEILYIEADSNSTLIAFTNGKQVAANRSLKEYEENLCNGSYPFIRIHNSFIINIHYVTRYVKEDGGYAVMDNKKSIPISKQKKEEFLKRINAGRE